MARFTLPNDHIGLRLRVLVELVGLVVEWLLVEPLMRHLLVLVEVLVDLNWEMALTLENMLLSIEVGWYLLSVLQLLLNEAIYLATIGTGRVATITAYVDVLRVTLDVDVCYVAFLTIFVKARHVVSKVWQSESRISKLQALNTTLVLLHAVTLEDHGVLEILVLHETVDLLRVEGGDDDILAISRPIILLHVNRGFGLLFLDDSSLSRVESHLLQIQLLGLLLRNHLHLDVLPVRLCYDVLLLVVELEFGGFGTSLLLSVGLLV